MNSKYITGIGAFLLAAFAAHAQPTEPATVALQPAAPVTPTANVASSNALYRQFDELRSQNAILAEQLRNAKLKSEILSAGAGVPALTGTAPFSGSIQAPQTAQVEMVSGSGTQLVAQILLPSGARINARVGTALAGLGVIKSISRNEVLILNKGEITSLPFARENAYVAPAIGSPVMNGVR